MASSSITVPLLPRDVELGAAAIRGAGTTWLLTASLMLGDMFGLGQLTLPQTMSRLGYVPGGALLLLFCSLALYSGFLYQRLALLCPEAAMFDQVARKALGSLGVGMVFGSMYISIFLCPLIFQITCAEALMQVLYQYHITPLAANLAVAAAMIPLAQAQDMEDVAWVSLLGTIGMFMAVVVVIGKLVVILWQQAQGMEPPAATHSVGAQSFGMAVVGIMDVLFCYGGQPNWWRYITSMSEPRQFTRATTLALSFMTLCYVSVAVIGYLALGDTVDLTKALTSLLPQDIWTAAMNAGLFAHCLFAYQININVWASSLLSLLAPAYHPHPHTPVSQRSSSPTPSQSLGSLCDAASSPTPSTADLAAAAAHPDPELDGAAAAHSNGSVLAPQEAGGPGFKPGPSGGDGADVCPSLAGPSQAVKSVAWVAVTCTGIVLATLGSLNVPFFTIIMALISSCGDYWSLIGLPCLFSLFLVRDMPRWEKPLCVVAVLMAAVGSALGLFSSLQQLFAAADSSDSS